MPQITSGRWFIFLIFCSLKNCLDATEELLDISTIGSGFTYSKCHCDIQEVWNGTSCEKVPFESIYEVLSRIQPDLDKFENFMVASVNINNDIPCSEPNQLVTIFNQGLLLADNGDLYHEETDVVFPLEKYCFEVSSQNDRLYIEGRVCLSPPQLPYCCVDDAPCHETQLQPINVEYAGHILKWNQTKLLKGNYSECSEGSRAMQVDLKNSSNQLTFRFSNVQMIFSPNSSYGHKSFYSSQDFCIENKLNPVVHFCYESALDQHISKCENSTCVRKCCPLGEVYSLIERGCRIPTKESHLFQVSFSDMEGFEEVPPDDLYVEHEFPWCDKKTLIDPSEDPKDKIHLLKNGSLYVSLSNLALPPSQYCIDNFEMQDESTKKAIVCFPEIAQDDFSNCKDKGISKFLYPALLFISCLFLALTLMIYGSLPELRTKIHGKCLISYVFSLLSSFVCQLIISLGSDSLSFNGCRIIGKFFDSHS